MRELIFQVDRSQVATLQGQIRATIVSAILSGQLPPGSAVPSTRELARWLKVSRNTVALAYLSLTDDGYLDAKGRSGHYVAADAGSARPQAVPDLAGAGGERPDFASLIKIRPSRQSNLEKPLNWRDFPFPFIYGQPDHSLFPLAEWRECSRQAMSRSWLDTFMDDRYTADDPMLIEQIRQRLLPRRGIRAGRDEILITLGAQSAMSLIAGLIINRDSRVGFEEPGYPDARNIVRLTTEHIVPIPVDEKGLVPDPALDRCDILYTTPSHQFPTGVTLDLERRRDLLDWARTGNRLIIEDDYEFEANLQSDPNPALKALDRDERVLYIGSLSKSLMPGLRLGFLVAAPEIIAEARALRRLAYRHPPGLNQRIAALFLSLGHHDRLINRLQKACDERVRILASALSRHCGDLGLAARFGPTSCWITGPEALDVRALSEALRAEGVLIETGAVFFSDPERHNNVFRLGLSSIPANRIEPGIQVIARLMRQMLAPSTAQ